MLLDLALLPLLPHRAAVRAHAEPEIRPLVRAAPHAAVPVQVRELAAKRLAVEGGVEGGAAGHAGGVEALRRYGGVVDLGGEKDFMAGCGGFCGGVLGRGVVEF